jgi:hypothetical protein
MKSYSRAYKLCKVGVLQTGPCPLLALQICSGFRSCFFLKIPMLAIISYNSLKTFILKLGLQLDLATIGKGCRIAQKSKTNLP